VKALVIADGSLSLEERPTPEPAADQVVVEVAGAGVNRADLLQVRGAYAAPPGWPEDVPGLEFSGTVAARGPGCRWIGDGDKVFGIAGGGAHATHLLVQESLCAPLPDGLDPVTAGGIPEVFVTAYDALVTQAHLKPGERVLIHGAGSGVGTAALQIVRAIGASSVGTARTPSKLERAHELGLDAGVVASDDMAGAIGEVDVVLDLVGGDYLSIDTAVCRPRGRILIVGLLAGAACAALAFLAVTSLLRGARRRLESSAAGMLGVYADAVALALAGLSILFPPLAFVALAAFAWLLVTSRRQGAKKYAGLRSLR